ncbi:hypothetical protein TTHT_0818 [Thermotomaculum hydrothermale]|uniref:SpaA-like prealbumin fold domain-containing protein n=1 Tax=Thermotomaculum hydrothermale TaxID=981385 RepID=A0A7R6PZ77_9BACT|nr:carboxypeptidase-like regulatory domain-containing protein [Thermotomaculum hydrothermale]BBB32383.1 hypothetical protein TTHT_0818 [Thermotomaculum hydrothermale]
MKIFKFLTVFTLVLVFTVKSLAGITAGMIIFKVVDENNKPLEGVKITITMKKRQSFKKVLETNKKGIAKVTLNIATYTVKFEKEGYVAYETLTKPIISDKKVENIKLMSMKAAAKQEESKLSPEDRGALLFNQAVEYLKKKDDKGAYPLLKQAVELNPDLAFAWFHLGRIDLMNNKLDDAERELLKAIDLNSSMGPAFALLADVYKKKGDEENYKKYHKKAEEMGAIDPAEYYNKAVEYINAGDDKNAKVYLEKTLQVDAKYADAYYQLGLLYLRQGDMNKCVEMLKKYLELAPNGKYAGDCQGLIQGLTAGQ